MALPISIPDLFTGHPVEWERLEFKAAWNPESVLRTLCAFANDFNNWGGGYIVIGVAEKDGRPVLPPVGLTPAEVDAAQRQLLELGHKISPAYHPIAEPALIAGKRLLVIWAPGGDMRPYKAPASLAKGEKHFAHFIRRHASTVEVKGREEQELFALANRIPFDDRPNRHASVDDLSPVLIRHFLTRVKSELAADAAKRPLVEIARAMRLLGGPAEAPTPLNVALLFFTPEPTRWFPEARIEVSIHPDGLAGNTLEERIFKGPLDAQLTEALAFLRARCVTEFVQKHADRAEATRYWSIPYEAIEESLVNAAYHRGYDEREPVEVRVLPDQIVIQSFPGPDRGVRLADLRLGKPTSRRYRNRRIGEFLKELELSEGRNTGIPKILRVMEANGSPAPVFDTDEDCSYFQTRLPLRPAPAKVVFSEPKSSLMSSVIGSEISSEKILSAVRENDALSIAELASRIGMTTRGVEKQLAKLKAAGRLQRIGPDHGGRWQVNDSRGSAPVGTDHGGETGGMVKSMVEGRVKSIPKTADKILVALRDDATLTARDLAGHLGLSKIAIEKQLAALKSAGRLRRIGPAKGGRWQVID